MANLSKSNGDRRAIATLEVVMLTAIAALLVVGIAYIMRKTASDASSKIDAVTSVSADDIASGNASMIE